MSRIGKKPIKVPAGVAVTLEGDEVVVKGPKGALRLCVHGRVMANLQDGVLNVNPTSPDISMRKYWGLYRTLIDNMVTGVSVGFTRKLEIQGTGYRAALDGKELLLTLGYSHPVRIAPVEGISFEVEKSGLIVSVSGANKEVVGQFAANIRKKRPPEPYHGKGIRYQDEVIKLRPGKSTGKK